MPNAIFTTVLTVCAFFLLQTASADVYSIWPFRPGQGAASSAKVADTITELLPGRAVWKEKIFVNGTEMMLHLRLSDIPLGEAVTLIRKNFPSSTMAANSNSVLIEQRLQDGTAKRMYLIELAGIFPLLQFSLDMPKTELTFKRDDWPKEIPLLNASTDQLVIRFPARNATYASYRLPGVQRPQFLQEMSSRLKSAGWNPMTNESGNLFEGSGEVYLKPSPNAILLMGIDETADGMPSDGSRASFYLRNLSGK